MEKIVDSFAQVDFSEIKLPMAVIYDSPEDYPGEYVCRIWDGGDGLHPTDTIMEGRTLEEMQEDIQAAGFTLRFPRTDGDDPAIVETWMR